MKRKINEKYVKIRRENNMSFFCSIIMYMKHAFPSIELEYWNTGQVQKWNINFPNVYHLNQNWTLTCLSLPKIRLIHAV